MNKIVTVKLWGTIIGYLGYSPNQNEIASFVYDENYINNIKISPSPIMLPLRSEPYEFGDLETKTFHGLPGFIADSLPDKFGNQLIDEYFAQKGKSSKDITALDRLLYIGDRAMGALSYEPSDDFEFDANVSLNIEELAELANLVISKKDDFKRELKNSSQEQALKLLKIGSSAGGARSKALVAIDEDGNIFDGTVDHNFSCTYNLLKFDTPENQDRDSKDPKGMPVLEFIYSEIARNCDIDIPKTEIFEDKNGERHFLIDRFDKFFYKGDVYKFHYTSWCGLKHADRDGRNSYEQLIIAVRELQLGEDAVKEIFKRAVFNIVGRNQDDHTKNFGFLMDNEGNWRLAPAFDLTYSYDPTGKWTRQHQISLNSKRDNFTKEDIVAFGFFCNLNKKESLKILNKTIEEFKKFEQMAIKYSLPEDLKDTVLKNLRLNFL